MGFSKYLFVYYFFTECLNQSLLGLSLHLIFEVQEILHLNQSHM